MAGWSKRIAGLLIAKAHYINVCVMTRGTTSREVDSVRFDHRQR